MIGRVLRRDGVVAGNNRSHSGPALPPPMPPPMRRPDLPPVALPRLASNEALNLQKVLGRNAAGDMGPIGKTVFVANVSTNIFASRVCDVIMSSSARLQSDLWEIERSLLACRSRAQS